MPHYYLGICVEMFQTTKDATLPYLTLLFNTFIVPVSSIQAGVKVWSRQYKRGPRDNPNNFRAVSLINCIHVCKIFMHVLINRLRQWCDENHVIDDSQAGFRRNCSTSNNTVL